MRRRKSEVTDPWATETSDSTFPTPSKPKPQDADGEALDRGEKGSETEDGPNDVAKSEQSGKGGDKFLSKVRLLGGNKNKNPSPEKGKMNIGELPNKKSLQEQAQIHPAESVDVVQASGELQGMPMSRKQRVSIHAKNRAAALKAGTVSSPVAMKKRTSIVQKIFHHGQKHDKVQVGDSSESDHDELPVDTDGVGVLHAEMPEKSKTQDDQIPIPIPESSSPKQSSSRKQPRDAIPQSPRRKPSERSSGTVKHHRSERRSESKSSSRNRHHSHRKRREEREKERTRHREREQKEMAKKKSEKNNESSSTLENLPLSEESDGDSSAPDIDAQPISRNTKDFYVRPANEEATEPTAATSLASTGARRKKGLGDILTKQPEKGLDSTDHSGDSSMNETFIMNPEPYSSASKFRGSDLPTVSEADVDQQSKDVDGDKPSLSEQVVEPSEKIKVPIEERLDDQVDRPIPLHQEGMHSLQDGGELSQCLSATVAEGVSGRDEQSSKHANDEKSDIGLANEHNNGVSSIEESDFHQQADNSSRGSFSENGNTPKKQNISTSTPAAANSPVLSIDKEAIKHESSDNYASLRKKVDDKRETLTSMLEATNTKTLNAENELLDLKRKLALSQALVQELQLENDDIRRKSILEMSKIQVKLLEQRHNRERELEDQIKSLLQERDGAIQENHDLRLVISNSCATCRDRLPDKLFVMDTSFRNTILERPTRRVSSAFEWIQDSLAEEKNETESIAASKRSEAGRLADVRRKSIQEGDDAVSMATTIPDNTSVSKRSSRGAFWKIFSSNGGNVDIAENPQERTSMIDQVITYSNSSEDAQENYEEGAITTTEQKVDDSSKVMEMTSANAGPVTKSGILGGLFGVNNVSPPTSSQDKTNGHEQKPDVVSRGRVKHDSSGVDQGDKDDDEDEALKNLLLAALEETGERVPPPPTKSWTSEESSGFSDDDQDPYHDSSTVSPARRQSRGISTLSSPFSSSNGELSPRRRGGTNRGRRGSEIVASAKSKSRNEIRLLDSSEGSSGNLSASGSLGKGDGDFGGSRPWRSDAAERNPPQASSSGHEEESSSNGKDDFKSREVFNEDSDADPLAALIERETAEWNS